LTCVASFTSSPSNMLDQFRKISLQNGLSLVEFFFQFRLFWITILCHPFSRSIWNNKRDKVKQKVNMNNYEEGGLKLPHIESYCYALEISWIQKILDPMNHSQWKLLLSREAT
jgi:hypothetical protein